MCRFEYGSVIYACGHIDIAWARRENCDIPQYCRSRPASEHPIRNMLHAAHIQSSAILCGRHYVRFRCCGEQSRSVGSYLRQIQARAFEKLTGLCEEYAIVPVSDTMGEYQTLEDATARSIYAPDLTSNSAAGHMFLQPWKDLSSALQQVQVCSTNIPQWGDARVPGFDDAVKSVVWIDFNSQWLRAHVSHAVTAFIDAERINSFSDESESETSAAPVEAGEEDGVEHIVQPAIERALQTSPSSPATTRASPETPEAPVGGPDGGHNGGPNSNGEGSSRTTQQIGEHRVAHHKSRDNSGGPQSQQSKITTLFYSSPSPPRSGRTTIGQRLPSADEDTQRRSASSPDQIASQHDADTQPLSAEQSQGESDQSSAAENSATTRDETEMFNIPAGSRKAHQDRLEGHRRAVSTEIQEEQAEQMQGPLQNENASSTPTDAGTKEDQVVYLPRKRITNADIEGVSMDPETDDRMRAYLTSERLPEHGPHCMCAQCKEDNSAAWKIPQMRKPAYKKPAVAKTKAPGGFLQDVKGYGGEGQPPYFSSKESARRDRDADSSVLEAVIEMSGGNTSDKSRMGEVLEHFSKRK